MVNKPHNVKKIGRLLGFVLGVLRGFKRNQGLLLSGAVAYYTLLSIVPMSILALIVLSNFIAGEQLNMLITALNHLGMASISLDRWKIYDFFIWCIPPYSEK
jgi:uncharacterized BrkB/YihY/UPF0761 family membrane protein